MNFRQRYRKCRYRYVELHKKYRPAPGFFDAYPRFFESSQTGATPNRLNERYRALIQSNHDAFAGKRVLDIASHDGRWSLAARKAGALHVLGIEARQELVETARKNIEAYGITEVDFVQGDVLDFHLNRPVDTVLCFGFFYHTIDHMPLLRRIRQLRARDLIIDTAILLHPGPFVRVSMEPVEREDAAAFAERDGRAVVGWPTRPALETMLTACGFAHFRYYKWKRSGIRYWNDLEDYYMGERISLRATLNNSSYE